MINFLNGKKNGMAVLNLYYDDLKKIDPSGRLSDIYKSVPSQLAQKKKRFVITAATGKQKTQKDEERIFELIESGMVLPCYNVKNPGVSLIQTKDSNQFKLYLSDVGLFTTIPNLTKRCWIGWRIEIETHIYAPIFVEGVSMMCRKAYNHHAAYL